jgi:tRNA pseudouridine38-40 synthase
MPLRNIKFTLQYDGTDFHGWQRQPDVRTVQGELEQAIEGILRVPVQAGGASRTDAGVHALGQVANFTAESDMPLERLAVAVNSKLPDDAAVVEASEVPAEFSSRFSAKGKVYHYLLLNAPLPGPLLRRRALHVPGELDIAAMSAAAAHIRGEQDYAAFGAKTTQEENTMCNIEQVSVGTVSCPFPGYEYGRLIRIEAKGDRFLYKMVRTIAGTLLEAGKRKLSPDKIPGIIESRDRRKAGPTLRPHGLYLVEVLY